LNAKNGIPDSEKVTKILGCFESSLVNDWISVNRTRFRALTFEAFMTEFRTHWLPHTWVEDYCNLLLSLRMEKQSFTAWVDKLETLNCALRPSNEHLEEDQIRRQLEANVDPELRAMM
jgi:hypothetical protein